jgi:Peptidase family M48
MRFAAFGAAMTLATFLLVILAASAAATLVTPAIVRALGGARPRTRTRVLLALRLLPAAAAVLLSAGLVLPAYLLLEPPDSGERVSLPLALLAVLAGALVLGGLGRGVRALRATAALSRRWRTGAEPVAVPGSPVPVYRVRDALPVFAVVGLRRPRMYVSSQLLEALEPDEIAAAVAHERAHLVAGDNLKRLLMRACPDPPGLAAAARRLEAQWARAAEALADERASGGHRPTALALAAGLVKAARLAPAAANGLPVSALHDGGDVDDRVRRLVASGDVEAPGSGIRPGAALALGAVLLAGGAAAAIQALPAAHALIEAAARLLR